MKKGAKKSAAVVVGDDTALLGDVRSLIEASRQRVATTVNTELALLYWQIGTRIRQDVLRDERAEYGKQVVEGLAARLTEEFGPGFTKANIRHMLRFAEAFPEREIVYTLCRQLSWSHFRVLVYLDDPLKREFYGELCRVERWSVRTLRDRVRSMPYERTALSRKAEEPPSTSCWCMPWCAGPRQTSSRTRRSGRCRGECASTSTGLISTDCRRGPATSSFICCGTPTADAS